MRWIEWHIVNLYKNKINFDQYKKLNRNLYYNLKF